MEHYKISSYKKLYGDMITIALYQLEPPFEYSDVISVPLYQLQSPSEYSDAITTLNVIW